MTKITKDNIREYTISGVFDIEGVTSADEDAKAANEGVRCIFRFIFNDEPLANVVEEAMKPKKINKQTKMRKELALYHDGQVIEIPFKGEGRAKVDPVVTIVMLAQAAGLSVEEYIEREMAKRKANQG